MEPGYIKLLLQPIASKKKFLLVFTTEGVSIESILLISFSIMFHCKCRTKPIKHEAEVWQLNSEEDYKQRGKRSCSCIHLQQKLLPHVYPPNMTAQAQRRNGTHFVPALHFSVPCVIIFKCMTTNHKAQRQFTSALHKHQSVHEVQRDD